MSQETIQENKNPNQEYAVGDYLYTSWGYDQTNVEWYKVLKLVGKSSLEVVEVAGRTEETGYMSGKTFPTDQIATEVEWIRGVEDSRKSVRVPCKPYTVRIDKWGHPNMDPGKGGYQRNGYKYDIEKNQGHHESWYA